MWLCIYHDQANLVCHRLNLFYSLQYSEAADKVERATMVIIRSSAVIFQRIVASMFILQRRQYPYLLMPSICKCGWLSGHGTVSYSHQSGSIRTVFTSKEKNMHCPLHSLSAEESEVKNDVSKTSSEVLDERFPKGCSSKQKDSVECKQSETHFEDLEKFSVTSKNQPMKKEVSSVSTFKESVVQESLFDKSLSSSVPVNTLDRLAPALPVSFSLSAYVNQSETLQQLVKLGVSLHRVEKHQEASELLLKLNFKYIKPFIQFLHDHGVPANELGEVISKNPLIFKENLDDLQVRINYLKAKKFSNASISRILSRAPYFITFSTKEIDGRLGFFQREFKLTGAEVRHLTTRCPKLIIDNFQKIRESTFCIKEEMGYSEEETKQLLLTKPKLWTVGRPLVEERFDYIHNTMNISHELILKFPGALLMRKHILHQRHAYLEKLDRNQYNPTKPGYVSLQAFVSGSDTDFCVNVAKTNVADFNDFLQTL